MVLDFIEILKVIFLGIVEGITEWLPISSTGHMILVDEFITLNMSEAFKEMFFVVIQLGAILAVVVMFWNKMFPFQFKNKAQSIVKKDTFSLWFKVAVACVPSAIMGILFDDYLDAYLQTPIVISIMLIFYGMLYPKLGEKARNNGHVVYSLDFEVTPHQLRHTYITNLIHSSVDPKTVQYLAGHESSKITMDIYAKVKYNRPDDLVKAMGCAFDLWDAV